MNHFCEWVAIVMHTQNKKINTLSLSNHCLCDQESGTYLIQRHLIRTAVFWYISLSLIQSRRISSDKHTQFHRTNIEPPFSGCPKNFFFFWKKTCSAIFETSFRSWHLIVCIYRRIVNKWWYRIFFVELRFGIFVCSYVVDYHW